MLPISKNSKTQDNWLDKNKYMLIQNSQDHKKYSCNKNPPPPQKKKKKKKKNKNKERY